jgi:hypothetical protein
VLLSKPESQNLFRNELVSARGVRAQWVAATKRYGGRGSPHTFAQANLGGEQWPLRSRSFLVPIFPEELYRVGTVAGVVVIGVGEDGDAAASRKAIRDANGAGDGLEIVHPSRRDAALKSGDTLQTAGRCRSKERRYIIGRTVPL